MALILVGDFDEAAAIAVDAGACELLLLPQMPVRRVPAIVPRTLQGLRRWVELYRGPLKLCINEASADGFACLAMLGAKDNRWRDKAVLADRKSVV